MKGILPQQFTIYSQSTVPPDQVKRRHAWRSRNTIKALLRRTHLQTHRYPKVCAPIEGEGTYLYAETPDISPVSVGPSLLHTESSGVLDGSASVTSMSWVCRWRCLALRALQRDKIKFKYLVLIFIGHLVQMIDWEEVGGREGRITVW